MKNEYNYVQDMIKRRKSRNHKMDDEGNRQY